METIQSLPKGSCKGSKWSTWISRTLMKIFLDLCLLNGGLIEGVIINKGGGFAISRFPGLNLFAVQCNCSLLPTGVRELTVINIGKYSNTSEKDPVIIATLSKLGGIRLETTNLDNVGDLYVSGFFDKDNHNACSLTLLLAEVNLARDVIFGCRIVFLRDTGLDDRIEKFLNATFSDLQKIPVVLLDSGVESEREEKPPTQVAQATIGTPEFWTRPKMILLMAMGVLLLILLILCIVLIVDRYKESYRNKKRLDRLARMRETESGGCEVKGCEQDRPLPDPPSWTYPQVIGGPTPRSPYNRLRSSGVSRNMHDDTGYDSDASMHYCRPFDDLGEATLEKRTLQTFGMQSSPLYATSPVIPNVK